MRFILDFIPDTTQAAIDDYLAANNCTVVDTLSQLGLIYLVECEGEPGVSEILTVVADDPNGVSLLDTGLKTFDIESDDNWWKVAVIPGLDLDASTAEIIRAGHGTRVYLLDSGIATEHSDFAGKDITLLHSKTGEFSDTTGHGTALASVIVGETCGVTEASLKVVKVFHDGQATLVSEILTAMNAVAEDFMLDPTRPAVMNLSWSINRNEYVESKILSLIAKGVVVVAAAGNSGVAVGDVTPACMPEVVTVGSFGQELAPSDFSNYTGSSDTSYTSGATNYGPGLDLFAPGEMIRVAKPDGTFGYSAGTSVAAAIMSAVTAANLAAYDSTYDELDYSTTVRYTRGQFNTDNLLVLEGNYANSPNKIPKARLKKYEPEVDRPPIVKPSLIIEAGQDFAKLLFSASYFKSASIVSGDLEGAVLDGNWLKGVAPATETFLVRNFSYEAVLQDDTVEVVPVTVVIFSAAAYPEENRAQLFADSGYVELECGCLYLCCGDCVKGNCSSCSADNNCAIQ